MDKKKKREERKRKKLEAFFNVAELNDRDLPERRNCDVEEGASKAKHQKMAELCESPEDGADTKEKLSKSGKPWLTGSDLTSLRSKLRERRKLQMKKPKLYLCLDEMKSGIHPAFREEDNYIHLSQEEDSHPNPLFMRDLQHLLLYAVQGNIASYKPRWCKLLRLEKIQRVVVMVMDDVSQGDCLNHADKFKFLHSRFPMNVEVMAPCHYGSSVQKEVFLVPLSHRAVVKVKRKVNINWNQAEPNEVKEVSKEETVTQRSKYIDKYSRTELLLSPEQMVMEHFPMPVNSEKYKNFVYSKDTYSVVTENSPMFALDCEMCLTTAQQQELTRVSLVNENLERVYDTLVKPRNKIINYLTKYSGITPKMMANVTTRLEDVQHHLQSILPADAILIGHSLNNDLMSLKMFHPYVIDTSVIYNLSGIRKVKAGLKRLMAHFFGKVIQDKKSGHNPIEDALSAMQLVQLKLQHCVEFGDLIRGGEVSISDGKFEKSPELEKIYDELKTNVALSEKLQKRRIFFNSPASTLCTSFFDLCVKSKKTAMMAGPAGTLPTFCEEKHQRVTGNLQETVNCAKQLLHKNFLVWAQFHKLTPEGDKEPTQQEHFEELDEKIKWLYNRIEPNSLVVVIATGRLGEKDEAYHNASVFLSLTEQQA